MSQTRRLAAILAADVAGYSRLMGADEEGTRTPRSAARGFPGHFEYDDANLALDGLMTSYITSQRGW